jgi:hypothetical protein
MKQLRPWVKVAAASSILLASHTTVRTLLPARVKRVKFDLAKIDSKQ